MQLMFLLHAFSLTKYQYWEILEHKCFIVVFYKSKNSTVFVEICWKDGFFPKMGRRSMCHFLNQFFNISDGYKVSPTWPSGSSVRPSRWRDLLKSLLPRCLGKSWKRRCCVGFVRGRWSHFLHHQRQLDDQLLAARPTCCCGRYKWVGTELPFSFLNFKL